MMKIKEGMSTLNIIVSMCDGNPGAMSALMELMKPSIKDIDPTTNDVTWHYVLLLDLYEIYGTDIYVLYNDICQREVPKMIAVLKATELDLLDKETLRDACSRQDRSGREMISVEDLYHKIQEEYPAFNKRYCYKTKKPCVHGCYGLCKESC